MSTPTSAMSMLMPNITPSMTSSTSTTMFMPSSSSVTSSSMSGMGMGMGMGMGGSAAAEACKISMLWNWYTIDACFLSSTWHVLSSGAFAGSCIGVIFLVVSLEFLRRAHREYDRYISRQNVSGRAHPRFAAAEGSQSTSTDDINKAPQSSTLTRGLAGSQNMTKQRPTLVQQAIRSLLYMLQFAVGYFVMLLAMYYNGYIIICIFIGAYIGSFMFQWDNVLLGIFEQKETCC